MTCMMTDRMCVTSVVHCRLTPHWAATLSIRRTTSGNSAGVFGVSRQLTTCHQSFRKKTWDALKFKFALKIIEAHASKDPNIKNDFVYVFGGSSVTAGHDNFYNESYPKVFERRMQPIFNALNIGLSVRNIAVGSLGCEPYNACYETFGGPDPDFVTW